jgi:hypothetical protein
VLTAPEPPKPEFTKPEFTKPAFTKPEFMKPAFEEPAPKAADEPFFAKPSFGSEDVDASGEGNGSSTAPTSTDEWVFETEPDIDPSTVSVKPLDTVEEDMRRAADETPTFNLADAGSVLPPLETPLAPTPSEPEPPTWTPPPEPEPVRAAPPPPPAPPEAAAVPAKAFSFGKRDPHEKASRLARVLVSDIITYNAERHQRALDGGTLKADFEDEIKKSWGEYVDQVGKELAESTKYFNDALNEILARGQQVF